MCIPAHAGNDEETVNYYDRLDIALSFLSADRTITVFLPVQKIPNERRWRETPPTRSEGDGGVFSMVGSARKLIWDWRRGDAVRATRVAFTEI